MYFSISPRTSTIRAYLHVPKARINVQKMQKIADGYPAIIVGDFNAYYAEKAMYNTFNAYLDDSRKVTQTAPVGLGTTFAQWNPAVTGGEPIDYVFCDRVNVLYETITEDFGRNYAFRSFTHFDYLHI